MQIPAELLPHTVTVRPFLGSGPYGDVFGDPTVHQAFVEDRRQLVVSASGEEVISETTVHTGPDVAVPVGSQVTVWASTPHERTARAHLTRRGSPPAVASIPSRGHTWRSLLPDEPETHTWL